MASTPTLSECFASSTLSFVLLHATWLITVNLPFATAITFSMIILRSSTPW